MYKCHPSTDEYPIFIEKPGKREREKDKRGFVTLSLAQSHLNEGIRLLNRKRPLPLLICLKVLK